MTCDVVGVNEENRAVDSVIFSTDSFVTVVARVLFEIDIWVFEKSAI